MAVAAKLDEYGRPAWIAAVVLTFMLWWPLGLATLAYAIGSGRMGSGRMVYAERKGGFSRWYESGVEEARQAVSGRWFSRRHEGSGNRAFDEYRDETLRRLEEEQQEFKSFLDRLRLARDKAEFDQFMADRRRVTPDNGPSASS